MRQAGGFDNRDHGMDLLAVGRGLHTRMVQANSEMPLDCATLAVLIAEVG